MLERGCPGLPARPRFSFVRPELCWGFQERPESALPGQFDASRRRTAHHPICRPSSSCICQRWFVQLPPLPRKPLEGPRRRCERSKSHSPGAPVFLPPRLCGSRRGTKRSNPVPSGRESCKLDLVIAVRRGRISPPVVRLTEIFCQATSALYPELLRR